MDAYFKSLDTHIQEMKNLGEILIPYNYPKSSISDEISINVLKIREVVVDGYSVLLHYSKADCDDHFLITLQILSKHSPFLPFALVCKIAKKFLGDSNLSLMETIQDNKKIYFWTLVLSTEGRPIEGPYVQESNQSKYYEGLEYRSMDPHNVNFY